MVGIEAAAAGLPAVAFDVGGITSWLEPGVTGEVASATPPTAAGLAEAIARALCSREHHGRLRRGALLAAEKFTTARHVASLTSALRNASTTVERT